MELIQLQNEVNSWIKTYGIRYFSELTNMCILMEEVGELSRYIARKYGEQSFKNDISNDEVDQGIEDEMADVLWVLTCLANQMDIDLTDAIKRNIAKKTNRDFKRHLSNKKLSSENE